MDLLRYETLEDANGNGLFSMTQIAKMLGVGRQAVHAWHVRRHNTHFPKPKGEYRLARGRYAPVFMLEEVKPWHKNYTPNLGGRPVASSR